MLIIIRKSNERILCKLSGSEISRLYSIVHVAMETTKTSDFTCQSKSFISLLFTCQVLACELQNFSSHDLGNDIYSQTAKTEFSHLNLNIVRKWKTVGENSKNPSCKNLHFWSLETTKMANNWAKIRQRFGEKFAWFELARGLN